MRGLLVFLILIFGFVGYFWTHPTTFRDALSSNRLIEQQQTLERYATGSIKIDDVLKQTLKRVPSAARIRVAFVHMSPNSKAPDLLRYDITNAATVENHPVGELTSDHSISEWSDYFSKLLNGQCADVNTKNVTSSISIARLNSMQIRRFLACPIVNDHRQMLGAIFMSWDSDDPDPPDMADVETILRQAANEVGRNKTE